MLQYRRIHSYIKYCIVCTYSQKQVIFDSETLSIFAVNILLPGKYIKAARFPLRQTTWQKY